MVLSQRGFGGMAARILLSFVGLVAVVLAQDAPATRRTSKPDFAEASLRRRFDELRPAIEAEIGRPFGEPVTISAGSTRELAEVLFEEHVAVMAALPPDVSAREGFLDSLRETAFEVAPSILGKVDMLQGAVHIIPEHFRSVVYEHGQRDLYSQDVVDVVLIHEAIHVHQFRHLGLNRMLGRPAGDEEEKARMAVIEGHAESVTRRVASKLGLLPAFTRMQTALSDVPRVMRETQKAAEAREDAERLVFAYVEGEKFVESVIEALGVAKATERLFATPPLTCELIRSPKSYLDSAGSSGAVSQATSTGTRPGRDATVRLVYSDGGSAPAAFRATVWFGGPEFGGRRFDGTDGTFVVPGGAGTDVRLGRLVIDGEFIDDVLGNHVHISDSEPTTITIERPHQIGLKVVDEATGAVLADARARRYGGDMVTSREIAVAPPLEGDLSGPLVVPGPDRVLRVRRTGQPVIVGAPGHVWTAIQVGNTDEIQTVALPAAGSMRVRVANWAELDGAVILVQRVDVDRGTFGFSRPYRCEEPALSGDLTLSGLLPGLYGVTVRRGDETTRGAVFGTATAQVVAGSTAEVSVSVPKPPSRVTVAGLVTVPTAWGEELDLSIHLVGLDVFNSGIVRAFDGEVDADRRTAPFRFDDVPAGRWGVFIEEIQWMSEIDVNATNEALALAVPEPVEVTVRVVDGTSGKRIDGATGRWFAVVEHDGRWIRVSDLGVGLFPREFEEESERGEFRFLAAPGWIRVEAEAEDYLTSDIDVMPVHGTKISEKLPLPRTGSVVVTLRAGESSYEGSAIVFLRREDDVGSDLIPEPDATTIHQFEHVPAGRWKVIVDPIPGFGRIRPRLIDVTFGHETEVVIDLDRAPESRK